MMYLRFFSWPWALALAVVLPVLTAWLVIHARRVRARRLSHLGTPQMIARLAPATVRASRWRPVRLGLAVLLAAIALAGPRWGIERTVVNQAGIDVVLALDASTSMLARDESPDRLARMKQVVDELRALSPTDRFALVAFAGSAYVLSPLTVDNAALNLFLDNLDPTVVGQSGSSVASAITMSSRLLASAKSEAEKAIVLMSDGEAFEDESAVRDAAEKAVESGASVITVGFGTPNGATIPVRLANGALAQKRDQNGQVVVTRYHPELLRAAADAGRGVFVEPTNPDRAAAARQMLATLRTQQRSITTGSNFALQYQLFLIPALLLLILDTFLATRHARPRRMAAPAMTAAAASAALMIGGCTLPPRRDRAAIDLYNRGTAMIPKPDSMLAAVPLLHQAAESADTAVKYRAGFNEGYVHLVVGLAARGDSAETPLDSALAVYKRVLTVRPDDLDSKWNYELALRKRQQSGGGGGGGGGGVGESPQPQPIPAASAQDRPAPRPIPGMTEQRAEQILNAMEAEEQDVQGKQQKKNVPRPPPAGKDW